MSTPPSGLYQRRPRQAVVRELLQRARRRVEALDDRALESVLEDALYSERKRLERAPAQPGERERVDRLARALVRGDRAARIDAGLDIVRYWADEIHGHFDPRVYKFATGLLPRAITGLLSRRTANVKKWRLSPDQRMRIGGDLDLLRELAHESTLVLVPTHVSNLDSPIIGLALYLAGLPPFVYGAGLNLFSNPVMGYFMGRLGAYTVDRTKSARLYKDVLKDYSVRAIATQHHSLFFPGGTRSRSHRLETKLKKGLMGTAITAWQENLVSGKRNGEVYFVPLTLTFQLVLEANTLIADHLEEVGKQRYIISDDESADARRIAAFARRVLDLDASAVAHFGTPIDVFGNPVASTARERKEQALHRRGYVTDANGKVEFDEQRDRVYTERLAASIERAYPGLAHVMANHLVAYVAWRCLEDNAGSTDEFRLVRASAVHRRIPRAAFMERLRKALAKVHADIQAGLYHGSLPEDPAAVLKEALERFTRYHTHRAVASQGTDIFIEDAKLCLYYRNRLAHLELEAS